MAHSIGKPQQSPSAEGGSPLHQKSLPIAGFSEYDEGIPQKSVPPESPPPPTHGLVSRITGGIMQAIGFVSSRLFYSNASINASITEKILHTELGPERSKLELSSVQSALNSIESDEEAQNVLLQAIEILKKNPQSNLTGLVLACKYKVDITSHSSKLAELLFQSRDIISTTPPANQKALISEFQTLSDAFRRSPSSSQPLQRTSLPALTGNAVLAGNLPLVQFLIENGIDPNTHPFLSVTPTQDPRHNKSLLELASHYGHSELVDFLISKAAAYRLRALSLGDVGKVSPLASQMFRTHLQELKEYIESHLDNPHIHNRRYQYLLTQLNAIEQDRIAGKSVRETDILERICAILDFTTSFDASAALHPKEKDKQFLKNREFFLNIQRTERAMGDDYTPFYTAMPRITALGYKVFSAFMQGLSTDDRMFLRDVTERETFFSSRAEAEKVLGFWINSDASPGITAKMLSASLSLFLTHRWWAQESALSFLFEQSARIQSTQVLNYVFGMLTKLGLVNVERKKAYLDAILQFDSANAKSAKEPGGSSFEALLQTFISRNNVNDQAYISGRFGVSLGIPKIQSDIDRLKIEGVERRSTREPLQARVVFTPQFYSSDTVVVTHFHPDYQKKMDQFFAKIIVPMISEDVARFRKEHPGVPQEPGHPSLKTTFEKSAQLRQWARNANENNNDIALTRWGITNAEFKRPAPLRVYEGVLGHVANMFQDYEQDCLDKDTTAVRIGHYMSLIEQFPEFHKPLGTLLNSLLESGELEKVKSLYLKVVELSPKAARSLYQETSKLKDLAILNLIAESLTDSDPSLRKAAFAALRLMRPTDPLILGKISKYIARSDLREEVLSLLGSIVSSSDIVTQQRMADYLNQLSFEQGQSVLNALNMIGPKDQAILALMKDFAENKEYYVEKTELFTQVLWRRIGDWWRGV